MISRAYRASLHAYPRSFRRAYGDDMIALLDDQLRDEHPARVVGRAVVDFLVTVPTRHLEAHMQRTPTVPLVITFVALAAVLTVIGGPLGLVAAVALLALAAITWRRNRPVAAASGELWWKLLLGGVALLGALVAVTTATGELPNGGWYVAMATMLTSFGLIGAGVVLGIARRMRPQPS